MNIYTDNTLFQQQNSSTIRKILITGNFYCFDDTTGQGNYDLSHVSNVAIDRVAASLPVTDTPILLDIECFNLFTDYNNAVFNLQKALCRWKSSDRRRIIGLYGSVPERNYWVPVMPHMTRSESWNMAKMLSERATYKVWQATNDKLAADLVPLVDFLCPSIYAFVPTEDNHWTVYAEAHLLEAIRISGGKPVWPIIWPKYNNAGDVSLAMWTRMVEFISTFPGIDNMIVYAPDSATLITNWQVPVLAALPR